MAEIPQFDPADYAPPAADPQPVAQAPAAAAPVQVFNPNGELVHIGGDQLPDAVEQGYRVPEAGEVEAFQAKQKYGGAGQQLAAGIEGGLRGLGGPLATATELGLGIPEEDIRGRREANPVTSYGTEALGLGAGMFLGTGEGALLSKAGEAAEGAAGLGRLAMAGAEGPMTHAATAAARIGSAAVRGVVENALMQSGDEVSKMMLHDPGQSASTAMTDIGLSGVLGGALGAGFGVVPPLWKATQGTKVGQFLGSVVNKMGGIEGVTPDIISDAIEKSGVDVAPEVKAALSADPEIRHMFASLQESATKSGLDAQTALKTFKRQIGDAVVESLGKSPEDLPSLQELSDADAGTLLKSSLKKQLAEKIGPIAKDFEDVKGSYKNVEVGTDTKAEVQGKLSELAKSESYDLDSSSPQMRIINSAMKQIENAKTLDQIGKIASNIDDLAKDPTMYRVAGQVKRMLREAEEHAIDAKIESDAVPAVNLSKGRYSVFTAENPGGVSLPPEKNEALMQSLYKELTDKGIPFHKVQGSYGPTPESSVLVQHTQKVGPSELAAIAKSHGQESIVHKLAHENRLEYVTGEKAGKYHVGKGVKVDPSLTENFTKLGGKKFNLGLDFDKLHQPELIHYSQHEGPLAEIDPARMGEGKAGRETLRGSDRIPRSYYYEGHSTPEDVVVQGAKNWHKIDRPNNILDLNSQEAQDLIQGSKDINELERKIHDAGFAGYKNTAGPLPEAVALFDKHPVKESGPVDAEHFKAIREKEAEIRKERLVESTKGRVSDYAQDKTKESLQDELNAAAAEDILAKHRAARANYRQHMSVIDDLNDRLHVGRYAGPESFAKALDEMSPEDVLRRLSPKGDAEIIPLLQKEFPDAAAQLKDYHVSKILRSASAKSADGEINPLAAITALSSEKISPEMRQFIVPEGNQPRLDALKTLLRALPEKMNTSGTAKTIDSLMSRLPGHAAGLATMMVTHNPITSAILDGLTKVLGRDVPDAARLSFLKFLGSRQNIDTGAFKNMVDFVHSTVRGESLVNRASKAVFDSTKEVLPAAAMPSELDRARLDKQLQQIQKNPEHLQKTGGSTSYYMPEHGAAIAEQATRAVNYLNTVRPVSDPKAPLDKRLPVPGYKKAAFNRQLDIAQQPLVVLRRIQQGTLVSSDVQALKAMHPEMYDKLSQRLTTQMLEHVSKGGTVPYQQRLMLSMFLGEPLDSTMTPQAIVGAQPKAADGQASQAGLGKSKSEGLKTLAQTSQTAAQARAAARLSNKG